MVPGKNVVGGSSTQTYRFSKGQISQIPGWGNSIWAADGSVWVGNSDNNVYCWNGTGFIRQASLVASNGSVWFLGTTATNSGHWIYSLSGGQLQQVQQGQGVALGVAEGAIWTVNSQNNVYHWNGNSWVQQASVQTPDGCVWFLGTNVVGGSNHDIYRFSKGQISQIPGWGNSIWAADGSVWVGNSDNNVYCWNGTGFIRQASLVASNGSVWFLGTTATNSGHWIYSLSGGQLQQVQQGQGVALGVAEGAIWTVNSQNAVYYWSGRNWVPQASVMDAQGTVWFLGTASMNAGHWIYSFSAAGAPQVTGGQGVALRNLGGTIWTINAAE